MGQTIVDPLTAKVEYCEISRPLSLELSSVFLLWPKFSKLRQLIVYLTEVFNQLRYLDRQRL